MTYNDSLFYRLDFTDRVALELESEPKQQDGVVELMLEEPQEIEFEDIDEALYDDTGLPPIPSIGITEPESEIEFVSPEVVSEEHHTTPNPEDIKALRKMIHHLGRLTIEVQMLRVQEQEKDSCVASELTEAEQALRQAIEELVEIKHHWAGSQA